MVVFDLPPDTNIAYYESVEQMSPGRYFSLIEGEKGKLYACLEKAADKYEIPYHLMLAIRKQEAGKLGMTQKAARSHDLGPMQINTLWLAPIAKQHPNVTWKSVSHSACVNAYFSAAILKNYINQANGNLWTGVGNYHHHYKSNSKRHNLYKLRVMKWYHKILKKNLGSSINELAESHD